MSGMEALQRGDARRARDTFERIVASGRADAFSYVGLAYSCRNLKDNAGMVAALEKALALEPRNTRALILKADHLAELGDARAAASFYSFAVQTAPPTSQLPADLREGLARAQGLCQGLAGQFEAVLHDQLRRRGLTEAHSAARFRQSLDILLGKKRIYFQQPHTYYFPELPQIQFYERENGHRARDGVLRRAGEQVGTVIDLPWGETDPTHLDRARAQRGRVMLAGGLGPENVAAAIAAVRPWAVDSARSTEREPGIKDHDTIRAWVEAAR